MVGLLAFRLAGLSGTVNHNAGMVQIAHAGFLLRGEDHDSTQWFGQILQDHPEDARTLYALATAYRLEGSISKARTALEKYLVLAPEDTAANLILGDIAYEAGDVATALRLWSARGNESVLTRKAASELESGNPQAARQLLDTAMGGDISSYSTAYGLAEQYSLLADKLQHAGDVSILDGVCDNGSAAFLAAAKAEPHLAFVRINHGSFLRKCQRYQQAIEEYSSVVDRSQTTTAAWANHEIGLTYQLLNQNANAIRYLEQAAGLDPRNCLYRLSLGQIYATSGRIDEARVLFIKTLAEGDPICIESAQFALSRLD